MNLADRTERGKGKCGKKSAGDSPELLCPVTLPVAEWTALVAAFATCFKALITSIAPVGRLIAGRRGHLVHETSRPAHRARRHVRGEFASGAATRVRGRERRGSGRGSGSARTGLGSRTSKRARGSRRAATRKGARPSSPPRRRRRLAWSPSSEFHLHGSLPSPAD